MSDIRLDPRAVRYIFLDRDGVLNRKMPEGEYVTKWEHFAWLAGAEEAVARINAAHWTVILVTNQRGVALGLMTETDLESIHREMQAHLATRAAHLDAMYYCPHDHGECHCRKPQIGLFERAMRDFPEATPDNSIVIGDSLSDIEAGLRLGMKSIYLEGEMDRQKAGTAAAALLADAVAGSLLDAVESHLGLAPDM